MAFLIHAYDVAFNDRTQIAFVHHAASTPGFAAASDAVKKKNMYALALENDDSVLLTPIIAETYGGWNNDDSLSKSSKCRGEPSNL